MAPQEVARAVLYAKTTGKIICGLLLGNQFAVRVARLAEAAAQDGARVPRANLPEMHDIDVLDALWALAMSLRHV